MALSSTLEQRVRRRARFACEYCRLPQAAYDLPFQIDHIIARQHRGQTSLSNLCLACPRCNLNKGPNIAGIDSKTRQLVRLYHPRRDRWDEHFRWYGPRLRGKTPIGRVTIQVLDINAEEAVRLRLSLLREGLFPPD